MFQCIQFYRILVYVLGEKIRNFLIIDAKINLIFLFNILYSLYLKISRSCKITFKNSKNVYLFFLSY